MNTYSDVKKITIAFVLFCVVTIGVILASSSYKVKTYKEAEVVEADILIEDLSVVKSGGGVAYVGGMLIPTGSSNEYWATISYSDISYKIKITREEFSNLTVGKRYSSYLTISKKGQILDISPISYEPLTEITNEK